MLSVRVKYGYGYRSPTVANNGIAPAKLWYGYNDLSKLRIFGSQSWAVSLPKQGKLEPRAEKVRMVGYSGGGYRVWNDKKHEVIISRDVVFDENNVKYVEESREEMNGLKYI
uniref:Copia protein n=1 Tax=Anoplophora glabripennis TaxID=217634 RepID=V5GKN0_ANOGL